MSSSPVSDAQSPAAEEVKNPAAGTATQAALYHDIFGDDDDDDDDLSDEDDAPRPPPRLPFPPRSTEIEDSNGAGDNADEDEDRDEDVDEDGDVDRDEDEDRDEDDVYVPGTATTPAKIPKFKKKKNLDEDAEVDRDENEPEKRVKKKKERKEKRRARTPVEEDEEPLQITLTADEARRQRINERIDAIGKKPKTQRKKKKGDDEEVVDSYHDDVCMRLRDRMIQAAERDRTSNDARLPATAKLAMLDEVMSVLRNTTLWQSIQDNGVLEAVRQWLEPIAPSGALPAVGIQKAIFEVLPKMELDTQTLKESRLGPIVLFYTKTKRVTPSINRQADALVQAWSRPIIKRPANLRSRHVDTVNDAAQERQAQRARDREEGEEDVDMEDAPRPAQAMKRQRFDARAALKETVGRKGARIFINRDMQYTVAPEPLLQHRSEDLNHVSRLQMDNKKFNKFARQMKAR